MIEIWKPVKGFENYEVSNLGNVRSLNYRNTKNVKILKPHKDKNGYLKVHLSKHGEKSHKTIHRLVADTFISNPNNYPQINHKDEIKTNNCVENLEWCDCKYNINHSSISACCKGKLKSAGKHPITGEKLVWEYSKNLEKTRN